MLKKFLLLVSLLVLSSYGHTEPTLLVVGDSLSAAYGIAPQQGWVPLLAQRLKKQGYDYQVANASISGDTTDNGRRRLAQALRRHDPQIVILELGANDGLRGLSLKAMQANLAAMIEQSQQHKAQVILLGMRIPPNYGKSYTQGFEQVYQDLAQKYAIHLVPFFLEGVAGHSELTQADGLHPTAEAQPQLVDTVWAQLEPLLKKTATHSN